MHFNTQKYMSHLVYRLPNERKTISREIEKHKIKQYIYIYIYTRITATIKILILFSSLLIILCTCIFPPHNVPFSWESLEKETNFRNFFWGSLFC